MIPKTCVVCKHFWFDSADDWYSELTPGTNAAIGCHRQKFPYTSLNDLSEKDYRELLLTAQGCDEFELHEEV